MGPRAPSGPNLLPLPAAPQVQRLSNDRFFNPAWRLNRLLQLTPSERAITRGAKVIDDFARRVIRSRRRDVLSAAGSHLGPDLLSRFLDDAAKKEARN